MKNYLSHLKIILVVLVAFILNACDNMTEEITINEDGTGTYEVYTDMVAGLKASAVMMNMMGNTFQEAADSTGNGESEEFDIMKQIEEGFWKDFGDEPVDSLVSFLEQMQEEGTVPDSIKNDKKKMALLEKMNMHIWGSKAEDILNTGILLNFNKLDDINEVMDFIDENQNARSLAGGGNPMMSGMGGGLGDMQADTDYKLTKKLFSRKSIFEAPEDMGAEEMAFMKMMFPSSKMKTIVHLPRKVKKVKGDHLVSKDNKTLVFEYDLMDMMMGKVNTDFEIKMK